jgi:hypothetical protein
VQGTDSRVHYYVWVEESYLLRNRDAEAAVEAGTKCSSSVVTMSSKSHVLRA